MSILKPDPVAGVRDFTPVQLLRLANLFARDPELGAVATQRPDDDPSERTWTQLAFSPHLQVWLIRWPVGATTGWHDHGGSVGAFTVVEGTLTERTFADSVREKDLGTGEGRAFGGSHTHEVVNLGFEPALSVHAYSPSLDQMTHYDLVSGRLTPTGVEAREAW